MICFVIASGCNSQNIESKTTDLSDMLKCPEISYSDYFGSPHGIKSLTKDLNVRKFQKNLTWFIFLATEAYKQDRWKQKSYRTKKY